MHERTLDPSAACAVVPAGGTHDSVIRSKTSIIIADLEIASHSLAPHQRRSGVVDQQYPGALLLCYSTSIA
jgi:hypothetical protein